MQESIGTLFRSALFIGHEPPTFQIRVVLTLPRLSRNILQISCRPKTSQTELKQKDCRSCDGTAKCAASNVATKTGSSATSPANLTSVKWRFLARTHTASSMDSVKNSRQLSWSIYGARTRSAALPPMSFTTSSFMTGITST